MDALLAELIRKVDEMTGQLNVMITKLDDMQRLVNVPATMANVRACEKKGAYATAKEARTVIHQLQERTDGRRSPTARRLRYYQCPVCQLYHLTKKNPL